jgi:hypothetical protein
MPETRRTINTQASRGDRVAMIAGGCAAVAMVIAAVLLRYRIETPPDNAVVITDDGRQTYASTPCIIFNTLDRELIANRPEISDPSVQLRLQPYANQRTFGDVKGDGRWKRDAKCNSTIGFDQIVTAWMRWTGYRARWSDEGQWRW